MAAPGANLDHLLTRATTLALVLQGVLVELHRLDPTAADRVRRFALNTAADLQAHGATGAQVGGDRVEADIQAYFASLQLGRSG